MPSSPLKIVFAGTPDFAAQHLETLISTSHQVVAVYTQPDRPAGRGRKLSPSPVKQLALKNSIALHQPTSLADPSAQAQLASYQADIMVVVAYGLLLPTAILNTPRLGCINVHGSLLPRWRGAAPIQRAVLSGDTETGISIMQMDAGLDTGDIILTASINITSQDTAASVYEKLGVLGPNCLLDALALMQKWTQTGQQTCPQDPALANYAHKLHKAEGAIDWQQSATNISQQVRGLNPWPVAYTDFNNQRLRIWLAQAINPPASQQQHEAALPGTVLAYDKTGMRVACQDSQLLVSQLQWPGGKVMAGVQIKNLQQKLPVGSVLHTHVVKT